VQQLGGVQRRQCFGTGDRDPFLDVAGDGVDADPELGPQGGPGEGEPDGRAADLGDGFDRSLM
jgi:hypothetical protein